MEVYQRKKLAVNCLTGIKCTIQKGLSYVVSKFAGKKETGESSDVLLGNKMEAEWEKLPLLIMIP